MGISAKSHAIFRNRASHRWIDAFPGERVALHVKGEQTGGKFACGEALLQPGNGQPLHVHNNLDEMLYVLEGEVDFVLHGERFRTGPGGFVFIPQGTPHTFRNLGQATARLLGVFSPGGMEGLFEAMEEQPIGAFPELAQRFGIEIIGPMIEPVEA